MSRGSAIYDGMVAKRYNERQQAEMAAAAKKGR